MIRTLALVAALALAAVPARAQGGGEAHPTARGGANRLSPVSGGGQSPSQAARDDDPNHTRASPLSTPTPNPNRAGAAASDGTAGTSSPRSPEPKPGD